MTASIGPTVRRRRLGTELRRLRETHTIKLEEVADKLGLAASTLSRIETGKAPTRTAYLAAMLDLYGVDEPGQRQILIDMAREGHRKGWWAAWEDVLPTGFDVYVGLEAEAASLRAYESLVVHGLLQTEAYARVVSTAVRRRQTPEQIERLVALRMQRQEVILRADPIELWLILDEAVIRRTMGAPELMRAQLNHLADASGWPNVTLQVLPFCSGPHPCLNGPFAIIEFPQRFDPDVVYTEGVAGQAYLERERDVRARAEAFDLLRAAALSPADSTDLIARLAREIVLSGKETLMKHDLKEARWIRSRACSSDGCVEVTHLAGGSVAVRDSKDTARPAHVFDREEWAAFIAGVKNGEFDLPVG